MQLVAKFQFVFALLFVLSQFACGQEVGVVALPVIGNDGSISSMTIFGSNDQGQITQGLSVNSGGSSPGMTAMGELASVDPWKLIDNASVRRDIELVGEQLE